MEHSFYFLHRPRASSSVVWGLVVKRTGFVNLISVLGEWCARGSRFVSSNLFTKMTEPTGFFVLSHKRKREQRKMALLEVAVFCWANFSPGASNLWLFKDREEGEKEGGLWAPPEFQGVIVVWPVWGPSLICRDWLSSNRNGAVLLEEGVVVTACPNHILLFSFSSC